METGATVANGQTIGVVKYKLTDVEITYYQPTETWIDGKHILHLLYIIPVDEAALYKFVANLTANGGQIEIKAGGIQAVITGQGLALTNEWDGYIDIYEDFGKLNLTSIKVKDNITTAVTTAQQIPHRASNTDQFDKFSLSGLTLKGFSEELLIDKDAMSNYTHEQLTRWTHEDLANGFIHG